MPKVTDGAVLIENLCEAFKKLDVGDQGSYTVYTHTILSAIAESSAINPQNYAENTPKNWEEAKRTPKAPEWKAAIDDELKSL